VVEPVSECLLMVLMIRGYEVAIRTNGDTVRITCPELPQLSVSDSTLDGALTLAEDAISVILTGRDRGYVPKGAA
jgi:hypothetical protein